MFTNNDQFSKAKNDLDDLRQQFFGQWLKQFSTKPTSQKWSMYQLQLINLSEEILELEQLVKDYESNN